MIKTTKDQIKELLQKYPVLRDNNERLFLNYLAIYHSVNVETIPLSEFFTGTNWAEVARFETVARCSRTLQENNEELRGKGWVKRQGRQKKVQQDLGYNV